MIKKAIGYLLSALVIIGMIAVAEGFLIRTPWLEVIGEINRIVDGDFRRFVLLAGGLGILAFIGSVLVSVLILLPIVRFFGLGEPDYPKASKKQFSYFHPGDQISLMMELSTEERNRILAANEWWKQRILRLQNRNVKVFARYRIDRDGIYQTTQLFGKVYRVSDTHLYLIEEFSNHQIHIALENITDIVER